MWFSSSAWMFSLVPALIAIGIVHKTILVPNLRDIPKEVFLWLIAVGKYFILAVILIWLIFDVLSG